MTRDPITVSVTDTCQWALSVMSAAGLHHLPVLDSGRLVGIVTEADVLRRAPAPIEGNRVLARSSSILGHTSVAGVMTYGVVTVSRSTSLANAMSLMVDRGIGSLPVVESEIVVGIVTHADVLRYVRTAFETCT